MKKSNKTSIFYIMSSIALFLLLFGGGCYGIYLSVGLSFVRNGVSNLTDGSAMNVSFGGMVNFSYSMLGVIILSAALIVISIFDFISLTKQISLFKQFKILKTSNLDDNEKKKPKNKNGIIFFAFIIDILSFIIGLAGIFINLKTFPAGSMVWPLYLIDGLVSLFSVISIVLLIIKLKSLGKNKNKDIDKQVKQNVYIDSSEKNNDNQVNKYKLRFDIDEMEYKLLKLKQLKSTKIISPEEYENLRNSIIIKNTKPVVEDLED